MLNPSLHILRERAALPKRTDNLLKLWIHRILVKLGAASCLGGFLGFEDSRFADYLNVRSCIDDKGEVNMGAVSVKLTAQLRELESSAEFMGLPPALESNIGMIRRQLRLSAAAQRILGFVVLMHNVRELTPRGKTHG